MTRREIILVSVAFVFLAGIGYGGYRFRLLYGDFTLSQKSLESTKNQLAEVTLDFERQVSDLKGALSSAETENAGLLERLITEETRNNAFEEQISGIAGTVGILEKLSKIDKELLEKYSKVYFLNEHYVPSALVPIETKYLANKSSSLEIHSRVWPRLQTMLDAASQEGKTLTVVSGYRSFGTQAAVKTGYTVLYGSGANRFSADQGYSEHQLGTTVDLTTPSIGTGLSVQFEKTPEYAWLTANAYRYGFVLSYPKNNQYYQFEPWHWRFVGLDLARKLHDEGKYFYDLDQREINGYLVSIFD